MTFRESTYLILFAITLIGFTKGNKERNHLVSISHPGISLDEQVDRVLVQVFDDNNAIQYYYMNVQTVVCGDAECKIDIVRIVWDELGIYKNLVMPDGVYLEKSGGEHFSNADYNKLERILKNDHCSLKEVFKHEVVGTESSDGIDGVSGATILLNTKDYVKGAVWTCYTLWHWVNGDVKDKIRELTGLERTKQDLLTHLESGQLDYQIFALEQLRINEYFDCQTIEVVTETMVIQESLIPKGLIYSENLDQNEYERMIYELFQHGSQRCRKLCLISLRKLNYSLSGNFLYNLTESICETNRFYEMNVLIELLNNSEYDQLEINSILIESLKGNKFLTSRLVYWFLNDKDLSSKQEKILAHFYKLQKYRL